MNLWRRFIQRREESRQRARDAEERRMARLREVWTVSVLIDNGLEERLDFTGFRGCDIPRFYIPDWLGRDRAERYARHCAVKGVWFGNELFPSHRIKTILLTKKAA